MREKRSNAFGEMVRERAYCCVLATLGDKFTKQRCSIERRPPCNVLATECVYANAVCRYWASWGFSPPADTHIHRIKNAKKMFILSTCVCLITGCIAYAASYIHTQCLCRIRPYAPHRNTNSETVFRPISMFETSLSSCISINIKNMVEFLM